MSASLAVVTFCIGWWGRKQKFIEFGLLLVILAYTARAAFIAMVNPWDQAIFFSLAVVVGAGTAYYMEVVDRHGQGKWRND
jgi:uncharacterized membrane protein